MIYIKICNKFYTILCTKDISLMKEIMRWHKLIPRALASFRKMKMQIKNDVFF